ncbi:MAG: hypothetical protein GXO25_04425 [Euryarchaeota archaeon]|nr:hypothetical protein [Euryarchaeota archaeon]
MKWKLPFLGTLYILSVVIRIYPVFVSSLPYNYDALLEARFAQHIANYRNLSVPPGVAYNNHHTPVTPFLNALLASISQLTGVPVMHFLPYIFPFIVSLGIFGWFLLAKRITGKDDIAAFVAILFTISGTYVLMTTLIWKQALGFALMPFALYTYKKRNSISLFLLILMPLVHHYVALIIYLILSYETLYTFYSRHISHTPPSREDWGWFIAVSALWCYLAGYYTIMHFNRLNELAPSGNLWLFLALIVAVTLLTLRLLKSRYRGIKMKYFIIISIIPVALFAGYFVHPIFPHTPKFNKYTFIFTFGYLLVLPLVASGLVILLLTEHKLKKLYLATLAAPIHMILFFFLRGFDLVSYVSISRTFDFLDFGWFTALATAAQTRHRKVTTYALVFLIISTTTPMTYFSMEAFGVNSFVYADEYHTAEWLHTYFPNVSVDSDERIGHIAHNSFDIKSGYMLPYELTHGIPPTTHYWIVSSTWSSGAQMRPMPPIKVNVNKILKDNSVIFSTGKTYVVLNETE